MPVASPHYLLLAESRRRNQQGDWRFVLKTPDGKQELEASDAEPATMVSPLTATIEPSNCEVAVSEAFRRLCRISACHQTHGDQDRAQHRSGHEKFLILSYQQVRRP